MKIAVNAIAAREGGMATLLRGLAEGLASWPDHRFLFFLPPEVPAALFAAAHFETLRPRPNGGLAGRLLYEQMRLPREAERWGADLIFAFCDLSPWASRVPVVVANSNLDIYTPMRLKRGWKGQARIFLLRQAGLVSMRRALGVVSYSETARENLRLWSGFHPRRHAVVPPPLPSPPVEGPGGGAAPPAGPYVFCPSGIYAHKNLEFLLEAFALLKTRGGHESLRLVIAGKIFNKGCYRELLKKALADGVADSVDFTGPLPYSVVWEYYRKANLVAFPSRLESWGYPVLEAMAAGVPSVLADTPVFRELAGEAAIYADPLDASKTADAMRGLLEDGALRRSCISKAAGRLQKHEPGRAAGVLLQCFREWLEGGHD